MAVVPRKAFGLSCGHNHMSWASRMLVVNITSNEQIAGHSALRIRALLRRTRTSFWNEAHAAASLVEESRSVVERFVGYYNNVRLHSAIGFITPAAGPRLRRH